MSESESGSYRYPKPRLLVSACLLGEAVRYDGKHKRNSFLLDGLQPHVEFIAECPEVAIGLGVPRQPIELVGDPDSPCLRGIADPELDLTDRMQQYAEERAARLADIDGLIFKARSPSCGFENVPVHRPQSGDLAGYASGLFAAVVSKKHPLLPVIQDTGLDDPPRRERFIREAYLHMQRRLYLPSRPDG